MRELQTAPLPSQARIWQAVSPTSLIDGEGQQQIKDAVKAHSRIPKRTKTSAERLRDRRAAYLEDRKRIRAMSPEPVDPSDPYGTTLSFTAIKGKGNDRLRDYWNIRCDLPHGEAFAIGEKYADEWIAFKRRGHAPGLHNTLLSIVEDMDLSDDGPRSVAAGFFWGIERLVSGMAR